MYTEEAHKEFLTQCDNGFIRLDDNFCILEVNNAVSELTGYSKKELEGGGLDLIFDSFTVEKVYAIYNDFGCRDNSQKISGDILQRKGEPRFTEIFINCTGNNKEHQYWLLIKNKSFRKELETKLRRSELMLKTTLESLPFDFWINDDQNRTYMQNSYSKALWGDVMGRSPEDLAADEAVSKRWIEATARALSGEIVNSEINMIIDGRMKYFRNIIAPIMDDSKILGILGMTIDISDLKESLNERDMLLKEVHHRVKNNLQMIISIIKLEELNYLEDVEAQAVFKDIIHRIEAVSMIHEKLYKLDSNNVLHVSDYIRELVEYIVSGLNPETLEVIYKLDDPDIGMDRIIILGLIVNELVTNSVKYAFNTAGKHCLKLSLQSDEQTVFVGVSDNGPGLPADFNDKKSRSLGFRMMKVFASQLGGRLEWDSSPAGCNFLFSFPLNKSDPI